MKRHALFVAFAALSASSIATTTTSVAHAAGDEPTAADSAAEARQQYQDGTKAFAAKRYSEAALHFEAAAAFKANAVALYTAALAWDLASRPERAADAYARALEVSGLDAKQTNIAKDRVAALEKSLGTVVVSSPEPGWKVQLDTLTEVPTPARLHGSPGVHTVSIRIPNKAIERRDVTLDAGKVTSLDLKEEQKAAPKPEPEPPKEKPTPKPEPEPPPRLREQSFWTTFKVVGVGVAGVGLAFVGAGAVIGTNANGAKEAYDAAPSRPGFDHASSLETWTNIALITGAVLVVGGIVLITVPINTDSHVRAAQATAPAMKVAATPGGLILRGTF